MTRMTVKTPDANIYSSLTLLLGLNVVFNPPDPGDPDPNLQIRRSPTSYKVIATVATDLFGGDEFRVAIVVNGTGFTYLNGRPSGGTATSISLRFAGVEDTRIDQFSIPLKDLIAALSAPIGEGGSITDLADLLGQRLNIFGNIVFFGNSGDDFGVGANGRDTLNGGAGSDSLFGFNNNDTIRGSIGGDNLQGGFGNDRLFGEVGFDELFGGGGNDFLSGGEDGDTIRGGTGNDVLYGQGGNDTLEGGFGSDILIGGTGDDSIGGEQGIDTVNYGNAPTGVIIDLSNTSPQNTGGAGTDTLKDVENVNGTAFNDTIAGSDANNVLAGLASDDILTGAFGADTLLGGTGEDTLDGGQGNDRLEGGDGDDSILGGAGLDRLFGGAGNDNLDGGTQKDTLDGGAGSDTLTGGAQNDVFMYSTFADTNILDFVQGEDKINLAAIDAKTTPAGDQSFNFVGNVAFGGTEGELRYFFSGGNTKIEGDTNGDSLLDFQIDVTGIVNFTAGDFVL